MVQRLPVLDSGLAALSPWEDERLFALAWHCVYFDTQHDAFDQDRIAMELIGHPGDRPKDTVSTNARVFQLFLTLAARGLPISNNSMHALRRVLDLDTAIGRFAVTAHAALAEAQSLSTSGIGVSPRTLDAIHADSGFVQEVVLTAEHLATMPERPFDGRHHAAGWAPDESAVVTLALKVIRRVRGSAAVDNVDRLMVFDLIDLTRWRGVVLPEALLSALAYVTGVVNSANGEVRKEALQVLWRDRDPDEFIARAEQDEVSLATEGRLAKHVLGPWDEPDRRATYRRANPAYRSLRAAFRAKP